MPPPAEVMRTLAVLTFLQLLRPRRGPAPITATQITAEHSRVLRRKAVGCFIKADMVDSGWRILDKECQRITPW